MKKTERRLRAPADVATVVRSLHPELKRKIKAGLQLLLENAEAGKALKDELEGLRSLRIGRFRIVYKVPSDAVIELVAVGPRRTIYEETLRRVHGKKRQPD